MTAKTPSDELVTRLRAKVTTGYKTTAKGTKRMVKLVNPDGPEAAQEIERLREALTRCRDKFLHYEDLHRLKCTSEGDEKADRNREMADMCDAALTPSIKRPE